MFHRPVIQSHKSVIMTWLCFKMFTSYLVNMETQSSSQSLPMDMSELVVISLKTWSDCALVESLLESYRVALKDGLIVCLLVT